MRWIGRRQSENVEDRRGIPGGFVAGGGCLTIVVIVVALLLGVDPRAFLRQTEPDNAPTGQPGTDYSTDQMKQFTSVVLADTEDVWSELFRARLGKNYREPTLVLFSGTDRSGCGFASAATGPFYCPSDQKVYIDLQFFDDLVRRFRAAGDFAEAYVIAHEVGHHVQNQLGILNEVNSRKNRVDEAESNRLSVRLELQADFLAGIWAHHAQRSKHILEPGDLEEALSAANAVGDDRLQKQTRGYVIPDSFTHGTSEQRARWFRLGFETGDLSRMRDTFTVSYSEL